MHKQMMRMFVARQAYMRFFHYSLFSLAFIFNTRKTEKEEDECNREEKEEILLTSRNFRKT
jgi:hypothetical protein